MERAVDQVATGINERRRLRLSSMVAIIFFN
jgi:hypothetical protein